MEEPVDQSSSNTTYTVVARRYRPKSFDELIGQDHVSQALSKAISTGRVGHAYLFTGARGVGKTSTARIFAKALSISDEMPPEVVAEIASAIDSGDDMDVIEIDGASNRRIEEIRQLRSNVNVRPGRARYKIYIIDEVHMLTKEAFNALLKTLEEPPEHVKFIFCTTDPEKIPITILSRCQRYDFVPVQLEAIQKRLTEIAQTEGFRIEAEAVALLARRAAGSMRDSQSLLEQVMSFSTGVITADQVHTMLGTADESSLQVIVEALRDHDPLAAIAAVDAAAADGADAGQMTEQLLNYLRDLMAVGIGGGPQTLKFANPVGHAQLKKLAEDLGVQTILSAIQILDESLVRMRASVSAMTLLEVALVQISQLEHLASIPALLEALEASQSTAVVQKKKLTVVDVPPPKMHQRTAVAQTQSAAALVKESPALTQDTGIPSANVGTKRNDPAASSNTANGSTENLGVQGLVPVGEATPQDALQASIPRDSLKTAANPLDQWKQATSSIEGILSDYCQMVVAVEITSDAVWRVTFPPGAKQARDYCDQATRKTQLISAVSALAGRPIQLSLDVRPGLATVQQLPPVNSSADRQKKMRELMEIPLIKKVCDTLDAEIVKIHSSHQPRPHLKIQKETE